MSRFFWLSAAVCAVGMVMIGLSGCAGDPDVIYQQAFGFQCTNHDGRVSDVACNTRPANENTERVSRYCYATIGVANCFDRQDQDRKNQELGSSGY